MCKKVKGAASFAECLSELGVPVEARPAPGPRPPEPKPDSLQLSIQGSKALPPRKGGKAALLSREISPELRDAQGNRACFSPAGKRRAEQEGLETAWETDLKKYRKG